LINVYDVNDGVQKIGYIDFSKESFKQIFTSPASRTIEGFQNILIEQTQTNTYWDWKTGEIIKTTSSIGWLDSHLNIDSKPIWDQYVKPLIK
jgi:hypothetical protein